MASLRSAVPMGVGPAGVIVGTAGRLFPSVLRQGGRRLAGRLVRLHLTEREVEARVLTGYTAAEARAVGRLWGLGPEACEIFVRPRLD